MDNCKLLTVDIMVNGSTIALYNVLSIQAIHEDDETVISKGYIYLSDNTERPKYIIYFPDKDLKEWAIPFLKTNYLDLTRYSCVEY